MSGSPKYTSVDFSYERRQREAEARARRAELRRRRQAEREAKLQALAEERARRRMAREARQLGELLAESRRAASGRIASVRSALAEVARDVSATGGQVAGQVDELQAELAELESEVLASLGTGSDLPDYEHVAEGLRARALALRSAAYQAAGRAGRRHVLGEYRRRLAAAEAGGQTDQVQLARCREVLARLESAAQSDGVKFDALLGTAEHAMASLEQVRSLPRQRERAGGATAADTAREAAAAWQRQDEAEGRLAVLGDWAATVTSDAIALSESMLAGDIAAGLTSAGAVLSAGDIDRALAAMDQLEARLLAAEEQLDEVQVAHERRADLAVALQDLLVGRGMTFAGGSEQDGRFVLQFSRPSGATYTATISGGKRDDLTLSYAIEGEQDVPVLAMVPGEAVCDQTEAFLDQVHAGLASAGFEAGELQWNGKPPRGEARSLPRQRSRQVPGNAARRRQHD